jgi:RNA polymerase sigma factor (sigma-70 family)
MSRSPSNAGRGYQSAGHSSPRTDGPARDRPAWSQSRGATKRLSEQQVTELVFAAAAGNQAAWDALVDEFNRMIWAVARAHRLGYADAADVVQFTWLRLVERLDRLHNPASVGGWLATTARRESLRRLNANKRQVLIGDDVVERESPAPLPSELLVQTERNEAIRRGFSSLRKSDQTLLRLLTTEPSLRYEEISAALGIPIGSIGPTRQRALERLKRALERQGVMTLLAE